MSLFSKLRDRVINSAIFAPITNAFGHTNSTQYDRHNEWISIKKERETKERLRLLEKENASYRDENTRRKEESSRRMEESGKSSKARSILGMIVKGLTALASIIVGVVALVKILPKERTA